MLSVSWLRVVQLKWSPGQSTSRKGFITFYWGTGDKTLFSWRQSGWGKGLADWLWNESFLVFVGAPWYSLMQTAVGPWEIMRWWMMAQCSTPVSPYRRSSPQINWVASWRHFKDVRQIRDRIELAPDYSNWSLFHILLGQLTLGDLVPIRRWKILESSSWILIDRSPRTAEARPRGSPGFGTVRRLSWRRMLSNFPPNL